MKKFLGAIIVLFFAVLFSCGNGPLSEDVIAAGERSLDPRLIGEWALNGDEDTSSLIFRSDNTCNIDGVEYEYEAWEISSTNGNLVYSGDPGTGYGYAFFGEETLIFRGQTYTSRGNSGSEPVTLRDRLLGSWVRYDEEQQYHERLVLSYKTDPLKANINIYSFTPAQDLKWQIKDVMTMTVRDSGTVEFYDAAYDITYVAELLQLTDEILEFDYYIENTATVKRLSFFKTDSPDGYINEVLGFEPDVPRVVYSNPGPGTTGISTQAYIDIEFNMSMNLPSVENNYDLRIKNGSETASSLYWFGNQDFLRISPGELLEDTVYVLTIPAAACSSEGVYLASDYVLEFTTEKTGVTVPYVSYGLPAGKFVDVNSSVSLSFTDVMDPDSVMNALSFRTRSGSPVAFTHSWALTGKFLSLYPVSSLSFDTVYQIFLSTQAESSSGVGLGEAFYQEFSTELMPATVPSVQDFGPTGTGVSPSAVIEIVFSEAMEPASTEEALSLSITGGAAVGVDYSWSADYRTLTMSPLTNLDTETVYSVTLATSAESDAGVRLGAALAFEFTTAAGVTVPTVVNTFPGSNATNIGVDAQIIIDFSQSMDDDEAEPGRLLWTDTDGTSYVKYGSFAWLNNNSRLVFTPSSALDYDTDYRFILWDTRNSSNGVPLDQTCIIEFRTGSDPTPQIPTGLTITGTTTASISMTWNDAADADWWMIYCFDNIFDDIGNIPVSSKLTTPGFTHNDGLLPIATYYYSVKAGRTIDGTDYVSPSSTTVSAALTPEPVYPAAPTGEHITSIGKDSISMEWDDAVDATSWRVYRAASYGGSYSSVSGTITTNSYTDDNLTYGTTYYYKIRAYNADGNSSEYSSILSGTTLRPPVMTDLLIQSYGATVKYDSEYDIQYLYRTPGTSTWYTPGGIVFPGGAGTQVQLIRFEDLFESENPLADVEIRLYCPVTGLASDEIYTIRGYFDAVDHDGSWSGSVFLDSTSALGGPSSYSSVWIKIFLEAGVTYQITTSGGGSPSLTGSTIDIFNEGFAYSGQLGDPGFDSGYLTPSISEYHYILLRPDTSGSSFDSEYGGLTVSIQPYNG